MYPEPLCNGAAGFSLHAVSMPLSDGAGVGDTGDAAVQRSLAEQDAVVKAARDKYASSSAIWPVRPRASA